MKEFVSRIRVYVAAVCLVAFSLGCVSCSSLMKGSYKTYRDLKDEAYKDKDELESYHGDDHEIYGKTAAGVLQALEDNDADALKGFLCTYLLELDGTEEEVEEMARGFKGKIKDTTIFPKDMYSEGWGSAFMHDSKYNYQDSFYVYTDKQMYFVFMSLNTKALKTDNGEDFVGVTALKVLTVDRAYNVVVKGKKKFDEDKQRYFIDHYMFADGTEKEILERESCYIISSYGDGTDSEYVVSGFVNNRSFYLFKLTGSEDAIKKSDLEDIDFYDEDLAYDFLSQYEPYATGEEVYGIGTMNILISISGSDKKLYVRLSEEHDMMLVKYACITDDDYLITDKSEVLYDSFKK